MKYFVISDIHSFASEMKHALRQAGYKKSDQDDMLIVCGDIFDRGDETLQVYRFLKSIPNNRLILIRGNHEDLLESLLDKPAPESYDFSNGTVKTVCAMADTGITAADIYNSFLFGAAVKPEVLWKTVVTAAKKSSCYKWFKTATWRNYYELDKFIFVHSFIPVTFKPEFSYMQYQSKHKLPEKVFAYDPYWRSGDWDYARWGCPYKLFKVGCFDGERENEKTLVCGHWDTRSFKLFYGTEKINYEIYFGDGIIGIDGCTAATHNCNVLVIVNNSCFDKYGNRLEVEKPMPKIKTIEVKNNESGR